MTKDESRDPRAGSSGGGVGTQLPPPPAHPPWSRQVLQGKGALSQELSHFVSFTSYLLRVLW